MDVIYEPIPKTGYTKHLTFLHAVAYYQVWNRGLIQFTSANFRFFNLRLKNNVLPVPQDSITHWRGIIPEYIQDFDYFLVLGKIPEAHLDYYKNMQLIFSENDWGVYKVVHT